MQTVAGDGVERIKRRRRDLYSDGVRNLATASGRGRLKEDLESSTWRRHQDYKAMPSPSNWLEHLPAGFITTWEDLTTRFLAQFFPPGRTAKLHNDILMFQETSWRISLRSMDLFQGLTLKSPSSWHRSLASNSNFYDHVSFHLKYEIDRAAGDKLLNKNIDESWEIIKNLALPLTKNTHEPFDPK
ncbi:zinc finger, CCHC-type containing protein [Tanacetum coccineum]